MATFAFAADCLTPPPIATEPNIRDAVLGHKSFTPEQLSDMDLNQDGKVDVADLVCLATTQSPGTPVASFDRISSTVREGDGTVEVRVNFSSHFSGNLRYTVGGSATGGQDYGSLGGTIAVDGVSVHIPVSIVDDGELDATSETVLLSLYYADGEGLGYVPGLYTDHCVYLHDNDAVWNGSLNILSMALHFKMEIIQAPSGTTGALVTDGYGIIPMNGIDSKWPADPVSLDEAGFEATVGDIVIPAGQTLINAELVRRLAFVAEAGNPDHRVERDSEIRGRVTETLVCASQPQFNTDGIEGTFTLLKAIDVVEPQLPDLEDVN